jgi:AraC-like DNA-binding protein
MTWRPLFEETGLSAGSWTCGGRDTAPGEPERTGRFVVTFVRRGLFVRHCMRRTAVADPNHVLFFNPDEEYRVSHPLPGGDDCTVFVLDAETLSGLLEEAGRRSGDADPALPDGAVQNGSHAFLGQARLHAMLDRAAPSDALTAEEQSLGLLLDVLRDADSTGGTAVRTETRRRHRKASAAAQEFLCARMFEAPTLDHVAEAVGYTKYHLARVFRQVVGVPMHRYRNRLRLRVALEHLADPRTDLSALAFHVGFSSHSHFTEAFRKEFGLTPSFVRETFAKDALGALSDPIGGLTGS